MEQRRRPVLSPALSPVPRESPHDQSRRERRLTKYEARSTKARRDGGTTARNLFIHARLANESDSTPGLAGSSSHGRAQVSAGHDGLDGVEVLVDYAPSGVGARQSAGSREVPSERDHDYDDCLQLGSDFISPVWKYLM